MLMLAYNYAQNYASIVYKTLTHTQTHHTSQQEERLERQEERLHARAVNAALHGNIGKAETLEVSHSSMIKTSSTNNTLFCTCVN